MVHNLLYNSPSSTIINAYMHVTLITVHFKMNKVKKEMFIFPWVHQNNFCQNFNIFSM